MPRFLARRPLSGEAKQRRRLAFALPVHSETITSIQLSDQRIMIRKWLDLTTIATACALAVGFAVARAPTAIAKAGPAETGRFVWHDLLTKDVSAAKQFYGDLFGWRFADTRRGDRPYVIARAETPVAGIVDISSIADAGPQWLSYMAVADVDKTLDLVRSSGGKVLVEPRDLPAARAAVIADPQGAPLGLAQLRRDIPEPATPTQNHFFWQEYLARDAGQALEFYKDLAGYESTVSDTRLGVDYHVLRKSHGHAGLFQLPEKRVADVEPNWLPYVLVSDPSALAARVTALGGRILVPAAPERRNGSLVVIADPGGAPLALQKYPY
jgi:predicted enzyme related to lactoylglutathione lyase